MLQHIFHLTGSHSTYVDQKAFCSDACVGDLCFSVYPHQEQRNECGEEALKQAVDRASYVSRYSLSMVPSTSEVREDLQYNSDLPQHQATVNTKDLQCGSEVSQQFLDFNSHHQCGDCENAISHILKVVHCQAEFFGEGIYEC